MLVKIGVVSALVAGLVAAVGVTALRQSGPSGDGQLAAAVRTRIPSPLDGLTPDQQFARIKESDAQEAKAQDAVRQVFVNSGADLSTLQDTPMTGSLRGSPDLARLAGDSTAIVAGTVVSQTMDQDLGSVISTVQVEAALSGADTPDTITIHQPGAPTKIGDDVVMLRSPGDPILVAGQEYVLFVQKCVNPAWSQENCLGVLGDQYALTDGHISLDVRNDEIASDYWALGLDGLTRDELAARLRTLG